LSIEIVREKLAVLQGRRISAVRLAASTLLLYVAPAPSEGEEPILWLDAPWRYEQEGRVVAGSGDISENSRHSVSETVRALERAELCGFSIDPSSHDLVVELANGHLLRTFNDSPAESEWPGWSLRDPESQLRYSVFPSRVEVDESAA
jgi:hypothetical protein